MANQPVKKKFDYEKYFSNEIQRLFDYISTGLADALAFKSLTFDIFLIAGLEQPDSMLYKALSGFLTSESIRSIHDTVFEMVSDSSIVPVRPNRKVDFSAEMKNYFVKAVEIMDTVGVKTITSDIVFDAFMLNSTSRNKIKKLFINQGITDDVAIELSRKARETMSAISSLNDAEFESFADKFMTMDLGTGDSSTVIAVLSYPPENANFTINDINEIGSLINMDDVISSKSKAKQPDSTKIEYCTSLNLLAERGGIEPLIGRDKEINEIARVLGRKTNNNVVLIGEPGVGKTAIVNGLAKRIVEETCPLFFKGCTVWRLDIASLVAGAQFRGQFESRINTLTKLLAQYSNSILFIDNIHNYAADKNKAEYDLFSALEPIFTDKNIMVIVTTTKKGYHNSFEQSPETARKFQKIYIEEPTENECLEIISGVLPVYEKYHRVKYNKEIVDLCVNLAKRYVSDRKLPSSALDILDETGSVKKIKCCEPESLFVKRQRLAELEKEKDEAIRTDTPVRDIVYQLEGLKIEICAEIDKIVNKAEYFEATAEDVYEAVSKHTGVPVSKLSVSEKQQLSTISETLKSVIVGQDEAIEIVSRGIKRNKVGFVQGAKPILSCMFIGNTGVGKTLFAKTLAKEIFGSEKDLVRFDMSEYADETAVNKLIGAGAGYVGYNEGGLLTEAIKNKKHCVVLIDEIEKAAEKVYNLFLQILDEGFLTDNTGYKVDFKNTILIMTSNVGTNRAANERAVGFEVDNNSSKRDIIEKELKKKFPPEFLNRLDEIVYFNALTDDNLKSIIVLELNKLKTALTAIGHSIEWEDNVIDYIFDNISDEKDYGARPIGRVIRKDIENVITDMILENDYENKTFHVKNNDGKIEIS